MSSSHLIFDPTGMDCIAGRFEVQYYAFSKERQAEIARNFNLPSDFEPFINKYSVLDSMLDKSAAVQVNKQYLNSIICRRKPFQQVQAEALLSNSPFGGICTALVLQQIAENKVEVNRHVRLLQKKISLCFLQFLNQHKQGIYTLRHNDPGAKKAIRQLIVSIQETFPLKVTKINNTNINGNFSMQSIGECEATSFSPQDNLIIVERNENPLQKTLSHLFVSHVIYYNREKRVIVDGDIGITITIEDGKDPFTCLQSYCVSKGYTGLYILQIEKTQTKPFSIWFSFIETIFINLKFFFEKLRYSYFNPHANEKPPMTKSYEQRVSEGGKLNELIRQCAKKNI